MAAFWSNPEKRRKKLLKRVEDSPFRDYLSTALPDLGTRVLDAEFLALDYETTGLDAKTEAILSIGYTLIRNGRVIMRENGHHIIRINKAISKESVAIHHITDDRAFEGEHLHDVMEMLLHKMAGRALLVHYARLEQSFTNAACRQLYGHEPPLLIFDTLEIERKWLQRKAISFEAHHLRLFNLRKQRGLPRYNAHNALEDAIATAELFLAQINQQGENIDKLRLKDIISLS